MAILEKEVWITLSSTVISYYENIGYEIPRYKDKQDRVKVKRGTKISIKVSDLPKKSNNKLTKICDICGEKIKDQIYSNIIRDRKRLDGLDRCGKCGKVHMGKRRKNNIIFENSLECFIETNKQFLYLLNEFGENQKQLSQISKCTNDEFLWNCPTCKSKYNMSVAKRVNGRNCPYCSGYRINETNSLKSRKPDLANEWHPIMNEALTPTDVTCGNNNKVWWICSVCNHEWEAIISNRTRLNRGCPKCAESKGEKQIRGSLDNYNIEYISQKEFNGLTGLGGGLLSYDFYLPKQNLLIEYQGEFHDGSGGEYTQTNLDYQKEHDQRKREYAKQNNINLLEIWYWDYENIKEILKRKIII